MSKKPIIGVTQSRIREGELRVRESYLKAIWDAGGVGIVLPNDVKRAEEFINEADGLLLGGGGDILPSYYNENDFPKELLDIDVNRDAFEFELLNHAIQKHKPVLGICRGAQVMNVFLGGTLYPYVSDHYPKYENSEIWHNLSVLEGNLLHFIAKTNKIKVNSYHKQNIKSRGKGIRTCAVSDDGYIEAVDMPDHPTFFLGVQFHPEKYYRSDATARGIFEEFVKAAKDFVVES